MDLETGIVLLTALTLMKSILIQVTHANALLISIEAQVMINAIAAQNIITLVTDVTKTIVLDARLLTSCQAMMEKHARQSYMTVKLIQHSSL